MYRDVCAIESCKQLSVARTYILYRDVCAMESCKQLSVARTYILYRDVAQLVARLLWEQDVAGSNPVIPTKKQPQSLRLGLFFAPNERVLGSSTERNAVSFAVRTHSVRLLSRVRIQPSPCGCGCFLLRATLQSNKIILFR